MGSAVTSSSPNAMRAAGVRRFEPCDHAQRRGLAAAGRTEQHERLTGFDMQIERFEHTCAAKRFRTLRERDGNGVEFHGGTALKTETATRFFFALRWPVASTPSHCIATRSGIVMMKNRMV